MWRVALALFCLAAVAYCHCPNGQKKTFGCNLVKTKCQCEHGCDLEFQFTTKEACKTWRFEALNDPCLENPCFHNGICSQIHSPPGYKCNCHGTGFHGKHCQHSCNALTAGDADNFPDACAVV